MKKGGNMSTGSMELNRIVEKQIKKWEISKERRKDRKEAPLPVITISRQPGSIVNARVDLNSSVVNYSGTPIQKRYLMYRQSESYGPLINQRWDYQ